MALSMAPAPDRDFKPSIRAHLASLETSVGRVGEPHREAAATLSGWIEQQLSRGEPAHIIVICTGNSRRSVFGSVMGNVVASYYNLPDVYFHSGGTAPSAFNPRTARALAEIGVEITATGQEAVRGEDIPNPIYRISWGKGETLEFSKIYCDLHNPQKDFAALLVCSEADGGCPVVTGASLRIPCPFVDPKEADGLPHEAERYAEKRDEIGRFMLLVLGSVARNSQL